MKKLSVAALALAFAAASLTVGSLSAAQLYRWVDDKGNVEWRDTPPPSTAKKVEQRTMTGNTIDTSAVPFSVQQAMKTHPVTLWVFDCGEPCTNARAHLARRGVPHTERNSQKEFDGLQKATGGNEVPVLIVGSVQLKGYLESTWDAALDTAGYPRSPYPGMKTKPAATAKAADTPAKPATPGSAKPAPTPTAK